MENLILIFLVDKKEALNRGLLDYRYRLLFI
jgi:hypothetical protein